MIQPQSRKAGQFFTSTSPDQIETKFKAYLDEYGIKYESKDEKYKIILEVEINEDEDNQIDEDDDEDDKGKETGTKDISQFLSKKEQGDCEAKQKTVVMCMKIYQVDTKREGEPIYCVEFMRKSG